jgi:hypothetical protein
VVSSLELRCASEIFLFLYFSLSPLSSQRKRKRSWRHTKTKIMTKISTRQIQRHQERSPMVARVCHMSYLNANEPQHIWTAHVTHFGHHSWPFLVSLDYSCQYLFNSTGGVVIRDLMCLRGLFFLFLFFSFYCKLCQPIFNFREVCTWNLRVVYVIYNSLNYAIFLNIFFYYVIFFDFLSAKVQKCSNSCSVNNEIE